MKERGDDERGHNPLRPRNHHHHHHHHRPSDDTSPESDPLLAVNRGNEDDDDEDEFEESDVFQTKDDGPNITEDSFVDDYTDDFIDEAAYGVLDDKPNDKSKENDAKTRSAALPDVFEDEPIAGNNTANKKGNEAQESAPTSPLDDDASVSSSSSSSSRVVQ